MLIHHFVADEYVKNVFQIDLEKLKNEGKRVIFTDLDNTLVGAAVKAPTPEIIEFLNQAKDLGFEVIIVSNIIKSVSLILPKIYRLKRLIIKH